MSVADDVRARAEEFRTRIRSRIEELRGGGSSGASSSSGGILGGGILNQLGGSNPGGILADVREKGLLGTARDRFEKLRGPAPAPAPSPPAEEVARPEFVTPEQWARLPRETKEALAEGSGVKYEAARESLKWVGVEMLTPGKFQRGKIAIEGS